MAIDSANCYGFEESLALEMATVNPFDLLGGDDNDDPSQLIAAAQQQKVAASTVTASGGKKSPSAAALAAAKMPTKPVPPSQAGSNSAKGESQKDDKSVVGEYKQPLVWIDLEMTGLDIEVDRILEIACIVTDGKLTKSVEGPDLVISQPKEYLDNMGEWCRTHHAANGLTERVLHSIVTERDAEKQVIEFIKKHIGSDMPLLAGNSVYVDLLFLKKYMPNLAAIFPHVLVDVSSIVALCVRWFPKGMQKTSVRANLKKALSKANVSKEWQDFLMIQVRARAADLGLSAGNEINLLESRDVHIHFPAGAVPKDGQLAGVTLVTSLVSLFSQRKVRANTAITGEMMLRGLVLPVGGIKDKVLAAHHHGIKRVILPERNLKDLVEIPSVVLAGIEILFAKRVKDVLEHAFEGGCP